MASAPQLPLFYNELQPLSSELHEDFRLRSVDRAPWLATQHARDSASLLFGMSAAVLKVATSFGGSTTFGNRKGIGRTDCCQGECQQENCSEVSYPVVGFARIQPPLTSAFLANSAMMIRHIETHRGNPFLIALAVDWYWPSRPAHPGPGVRPPQHLGGGGGQQPLDGAQLHGNGVDMGQRRPGPAGDREMVSHLHAGPGAVRG